jgi:hypothetical protein
MSSYLNSFAHPASNAKALPFSSEERDWGEVLTHPASLHSAPLPACLQGGESLTLKYCWGEVHKWEGA